jgi:N-acetylglucosamine kinase
MRTYLGIDGGGTKTAAVILDEAGVERGHGSGGPCNLITCEDSTLKTSLQAAVRGALRAAGWEETHRFTGVCAGVAGYSASPRLPALERILHDLVPADSYRIEPDYLIAYWGATEGEPGIIVIAGTGAVSFGRNAEGETQRVDGLGYLLGDRGSGFNLGLHILRHVMEQMQQGHQDALTEAVLAHTGTHSQNEILHWLYGGFHPARVAGLAPIVGALAEAGDTAARNHVAEMARRLRHAVRQIRHSLWLPRDTPVYPLGGLWQLGSFFLSEFTDPQWSSGNGSGPEPEALPGGRFVLATPKHDAVYGAALLSRVSGVGGRGSSE